MYQATTYPQPTFKTHPLLGSAAVRVALGTLVLAASSWISIPLSPIPITMQTYAVIVLGALFGARIGVITVLAWLAEAATGLPVLAHGAAGIHALLGPSAGYIVSFPAIAAFAGWLSDRKLDRGIATCLLSMLAANAINLGLGVLWLSILLGTHRAFLVGFAPFWVGALIKAALATCTLTLIRSRRSTATPQASEGR